ncbi:MAG: DUF1127 domain-containing protein [Pseudomonadota bacterium]
MTALALSYTRPLFHGVAEFWANIVDNYKLHREYRDTLNELRELSPRDLADLGEGYMSAEALAYRAVYRVK